jgi:hypothetical protein
MYALGMLLDKDTVSSVIFVRVDTKHFERKWRQTSVEINLLLNSFQVQLLIDTAFSNMCLKFDVLSNGLFGST